MVNLSNVFLPVTITVAVSTLLYSFYVFVPRLPVLQIDKDGYWKSGELVRDDDDIKTYSIDVSPNKVTAFKEALGRSKIQRLEGDDVESDTFLKNLTKVLVDYDWEQHQHFLNTFKQYTTEIEGLNVHFARVSTPTGKGKQLVPILLLHGFPGSFWDFFKLIPILSNPTRHGFDFGVKEAIHFDVVVPSLPGVVFSEKPTRAGLDAAASVRILAKLMQRLDVAQYFVHGSEGFGTDLAALLASVYPENVVGLHLSNPFVRPTFSTTTLVNYAVADFIGDQSSTSLPDYFQDSRFHIDANFFPIAAALQDSPLGLVIYLMDHWKKYSIRDNTTQLNALFTLDELATEIYIYWLTETAPIALRLLHENYNVDTKWTRSQVSVPAAVCYTPNTPWRTSKEILAHKFFNITRHTELPKGGLFHHLQDPNSIAADIFSFVELQLL